MSFSHSSFPFAPSVAPDISNPNGHELVGFECNLTYISHDMTKSHSDNKSCQRLISPPDLPVLEQLRQWGNAKLADNEFYSTSTGIKLNLSNQTATKVQFDRINLDCSDLNGTKLLGFKLCDSRLNQSDLANANWHGAQLVRVEMTDCRMLGLTITEGKLRDCMFMKCNGSYMRFRFASFNAVRFEECDLRDSDFQGTDLSGVEFYRCDLRNAQMSGVKLKGASLRGSKIEGLAINAKDLEGAIIDPMQAAYLAPLFGVKVVW